MRILLTGGNGFVGNILANHLRSKGHQLVSLDKFQPRHTIENVTYLQLDLEENIKPEIVEGFDAVIHLAGEPIFGFWSKTKMQRIYDSRVNSTRNIVKALSQVSYKPKVFVSASGIGYYGDAGNDILTEQSAVGHDFLSQVCTDWEAAAQKADELGIRTVQVRTSPVIGKGGIVAMLSFYFKLGIGIWIGNGRNWMPWIDIADLVSIYDLAIHETRLKGPVNAVTGSVPQKEYMKSLGKAVHRPVLFGVPVFILGIRYGKFARSLVASQRAEVSPKLSDADYKPENLDLLASMKRATKK